MTVKLKDILPGVVAQCVDECFLPTEEETTEALKQLIRDGVIVLAADGSMQFKNKGNSNDR